MDEKERKLKKVIMEYDNGDKEYIEETDAIAWLDTLNSAIVHSYIHGSNVQNILKGIEWKKTN